MALRLIRHGLFVVQGDTSARYLQIQRRWIVLFALSLFVLAVVKQHPGLFWFWLIEWSIPERFWQHTLHRTPLPVDWYPLFCSSLYMFTLCFCLSLPILAPAIILELVYDIPNKRNIKEWWAVALWLKFILMYVYAPQVFIAVPVLVAFLGPWYATVGRILFHLVYLTTI